MMFHTQMDPQSGVDIEQMLIELAESVDAERMAAAWSDILERYPVLTSECRLDPNGGFVLHERGPDPGIEIQRIDLVEYAFAEQQRRVEEFLREDRLRGFDLSNGPAMRVCLFYLAHDQTLMVWSFHHLLLDGRAFTLVIREVLNVYDGAPADVAIRGPEFREYAKWKAALSDEAGLEYWKEQLKGFHCSPSLPQCRSGLKNEAYGEIETHMSAPVAARLSEALSGTGFSLNTALTTAWAIALSRYGTTSDVVFGVTKTTRRSSIEGADTTIGMLLATLPLRIRIDADASLRGLMTQVRSAWNALKDHEHVSLADIKRIASATHGDFFDSLVVFEREHFGDVLRRLGGKWSDRRFSLREQSSYAVTLYGYGGERLTLKLGFDRRRINEACAGRILGHVVQLLEQFAEGLDRPVVTLELLSAEEQNLLTHAWNRTGRAFDLETPVDVLVQQTARTSPNSVAVEFGDRRLTYGQLEERIEQIAALLRAEGAGRSDVIGVLLPRSEQLPGALLGVLRTGAAYVPLDPDLPDSRLAHMVNDAGVKVVLTSAEIWKADLQLGVKRVDIAGSAPAHQPAKRRMDGTDLAYVLYTSGSTGLPKGVEIPHRGLSNFLLAMRELFPLQPGDSVAAITTISFDIAALELFLPLISGAIVKIVPREVASDGQALERWIKTVRPTHLQATPTTWRMLFESGWTGAPELVALCGGEALTSDLSDKLTSACGQAWNVYGPTETTVWSTAHRLVPGEAVTIGRPIANTQTYIVDARMRPVPVGCIGELLIGGAGVARGYRNRVELTTERFVNDPFFGSGRLYRTGDLARFAEDGTIECLGRNDSQVKVRGFRIELGEIEAALERCPQVERCAVIARRLAGAAEASLAAYVVADGALTAKQIREFLLSSLPGYMVPSYITFLQALPETPNRKIDRNALPDPVLVASSVSADEPPKTHTQIKIAEAFMQALRVHSVGIDEDFFDLGGTSVAAARMFAQLNAEFGRRFSLNMLFRARTVRELAAQLESVMGHSDVEHSLVRIRSAGSATPLFWIPGGRAVSALAFRHLVEELPNDVPVYSFETKLNREMVFSTVEERAATYLQLIRDVQANGPYRIGGFCLGGFVAFEIARLLIESGEQVQFLGLVNSYLPRPLSRSERTLLALQKVVRKARTLTQGRSAANSAEIDDFDFRSEQQNMKVMTQYVPLPLDIEIDLYISELSEFHGLSERFDTRLTWTGLVRAWRVATIAGDHTSMLEPPQVSRLASAITARLNSGPIQTKTSVSAAGSD